jgi:phage terminase small subunit
MNSTPEMPPDLDYQAQKKWEELVGSCDVDADAEMLANYCRQHSTLLVIRREKKRQQKSGRFKTMVPGRDGTQVLNPLLVTENRLIASLNRTLKTLGLTSTQRKKAGRTSPAMALQGVDTMELILCGLRVWNPAAKRFEDVTH